MAYYAALVPLVQSLEEIMSHYDHRYEQIASLYEKFSHLQELLEDYSPKLDEEVADCLERRIKDAAYRAQDIIESHIFNQIPQQLQHQRCKECNEDLEKVNEEVASIVEELSRIKKSHNTHEDLELDNSSTDHAGSSGQAPSGRNTMVGFDEHLTTTIKAQLCGESSRLEVVSIVGMGGLGQTTLAKHTSSDCLERRIRDAAYRAQDIIESRILDQIPRQLQHRRSKECNEDLEKVNEEVASTVEELLRIKRSHNTREDLVLDNSSTYHAGSSGQAPSGRNAMVGFDKHLTTTIKAQLCGESSRLEVVSIVGMGGIGKTTLAKDIFDDELVAYHFYCHAWVTVSQDYHLRKILLDIGTSMNILDEKLRKGGTEEVLKEHIYKHLKGRRYLVIMDDMWDTKVWDDIKRILPDDSNGSRIMVTTRLSDVAFYVDSCGFFHHMQLLHEDQSWNLFRQKVFCPPELEDTGRLIANNCRGLPLAITVVAGLLSNVNKTRHDWEEIARNVSSTANENDTHFSNILTLSYNELPHHLKPCFLYLGGFPEDYEVPTSKLIKLWVAEGFLINSIQSKSIEEVGEEYLEDLVNRNLVLITKKRSNGKFRYCIIHDLLRDLCAQKANQETFLYIPKENRESYPEATMNLHRRLFVHRSFSSSIHSGYPNFIQGARGSCIRSFLCFCSTGELYVSFAFSLNLLRVLDAVTINFTEFPLEIVQLLCLRYLALTLWIISKNDASLSERESVVPSSISRLQKLQTLIVSFNSAELTRCLLPGAIWNMPNLRHVMIGELSLPPVNSFGARTSDLGEVSLLGNLQTLLRLVNFRFTSDAVEMIPNLKKLKVLYSEPRENWQEFCLNNLVRLHKLETLDITFSVSVGCHNQQATTPLPESFAFPLNLTKVCLKGCSLPWEDLVAVGSLPNLQVLKLRSGAVFGDEWEPIEGQFPRLKFLLMEDLYDLMHWRAENTHFPRLERLTIRYCGQLKEIPPGVGEIPTLKLIEVSHNRLAAHSAIKIQEEQQSMGNDVLQVRVYPDYRNFW